VLIASGARAPQFRRGHVAPPPPSRAEFLEQLRRLGGMPTDDPALLRALLPAMEADAALYRHYIYSEDEPFAFPISAYGGTDDANIGIEHLQGWGEQTTVRFVIRRFPGGHFYLNTCREEFAAALAEDLA
jgi:surfactin synthase thioesterase subunit